MSDKIVFFIDQEKFETEQRSLTVKQLLVDFAKEDPATSTLVQKEHGDLLQLPDQNAVIALKHGSHFSVFHNKPTTVS